MLNRRACRQKPSLFDCEKAVDDLLILVLTINLRCLLGEGGEGGVAAPSRIAPVPLKGAAGEAVKKIKKVPMRIEKLISD